MTDKPEKRRRAHGKNGIGRKRLLIAVLLLAGFGAMEFPGILIVGRRVFPFLFGLPFLYGYIFLCWIYMCCVLFYAWRTDWGSRSIFRK